MIIGVGTDPKPNDRFAVDNAYGAIISVNPDGVNRTGCVYGFKTKTRVMRILNERPICLSGLTLHAGWQLGQGFPEASRRA
jgi:hypothetical protein